VRFIFPSGYLEKDATVGDEDAEFSSRYKRAKSFFCHVAAGGTLNFEIVPEASKRLEGRQKKRDEIFKTRSKDRKRIVV